MKKVIFYLIVALMISVNAEAKNQPKQPIKRTCGSIAPSIESEIEFQQKIQQFLASQTNAQNRGELANYTIPLIVHVIYFNATQNISDAQVNSQLDVLNADYAGSGYNVNTCPTAFRPLISNTNISFCKASKKPNGTTLAVAGIDRIDASAAGFTNPGTAGWTQSYINATVKPATIWDPTKYMNVWVLPLKDGLLGYATFPSGTGLTGLSGFGTATTDGVVIGYLYYGTTGTVTAPYNKGRTATHEVGHWLGLRHISGDSDCGDDFCGDTPTQSGNAGDGQGLNYGCPTFPSVTCSNDPNGDLFVDFMDYTDDACMFLFTPNQRTRIQTTMANGTYRAPLATSTVCTIVPTAPIADFIADRVSVCPGSTVNFSDQSSGVPTSWSWSISPNSGFSYTGGTSATSQNPKIIFNSIGTYSISLLATNSLGSNTKSKTNYINVGNPATTVLPIVQGFESSTFPPTGWSLVSLSGFNWARTTTVSGFGTSNACMFFNNTDNDALGLKDDIYSPTVNFPTGTTNPRIKFDVAYAPYVDGSGQENDTLEVLINDVCSGTITSIYKKGGNQLKTADPQGDAFVPTASQWRKDSVTLSNTFLNKNIKFIFRNSGFWTHEIYVDNVNIYGTIPTTSNPTALFTSDTTVCKGSTITFISTSTSGNATAVDSVRWSINGGTPSTSNSATVVSTFNTVGSYNISLVAYEGGVASPIVTKSIRVKALPVVTVSSPTICSANTATIQAGGATTYTWTGGLSGNPVTTPTLTGNASYTVTGTKDGCTGTALSTVTVNPSPTVSVNNPAICVGQTAALTATGNATTYAWAGLTGNPATTPVLTSNTAYTVTGTLGNCTKTATATITVKPLPTVNVNNPTICVGQTATLTASGTATSYVWNGLSGNPSTTLALSSNSTYTVTGTLNSCTKSATASVTVNPLPSISVNSPIICSGKTATITASGNSTNYAWSGGLIGNPVTIPILTSNSSYTVTGTLNSCTKSATASVTVNPLPATPTITQRNDTLTCNTIGGASYNWYRNGTFLVTTNVRTLKVTLAGIYTVEVVGTNTCTSVLSANFNATITGVKNNKLEVQLSIYPNPNNGLFEINITSKANKTYQLKLYNVAGQIISDEEMNVKVGENTKSMNLFGIEKGVYFLSIISDDGVSTKSILVQ